MSDNKELLLMLEDHSKIHKAYDTGIWVSSEFLANSLGFMFKQTWDSL